MFAVAVTFLVREGRSGTEVLLGTKRRGIGEGRVVGPGGKLEPGESAESAAVREVAEEVGLSVEPVALRRVAELSYTFPYRPQWSQTSTAFVAHEWAGEVRASDELTPNWFPVAKLPLDDMWADARLWLPRALRGEFVRASCRYGPDNRSVDAWSEDSTGRPETVSG